MAVLLQSLSGSGWAKVHLTTPNWARPILGGRLITHSFYVPIEFIFFNRDIRVHLVGTQPLLHHSLLLLYLQWELPRWGFWFDSGIGRQGVHTLDTYSIGSLGWPFLIY